MTPPDLHRLLGRCLAAPDSIVAARLARSDFDWGGLLETANRALLAPALCIALSHEELSSAVPDGVAAYLAELSRLNRIRNRRLEAQLGELVAALNRRGIVPLLLKGAAILVTRSDSYAAGRMVTDLDVLVARDEAPAALAVLAGCGYQRISDRAPPAHTLGDFARAQDVGAVDLHIALLNEPALLPLGDIAARAVDHEMDGLRVRLLPPTDRVLHLLLHDLVQDRGLHEGRLNLRHLHEFALLARTAPIEWPAIRAHLERHRLAAALDLWLLAAAEFFGSPPPVDVRPGLGARLLLWRTLLLLRNPRFARPSEILGNLHRSLSWYRLAHRGRKLPRIRRAAEYLWTYRTRTASRILHVLLDHRS